jgi:transposase-like protein
MGRGKHRTRYNEEFKKRAVLHHFDNHTTLTDSATRLGITAGMLSKWIEQYSLKQDGAGTSAMNYDLEIKLLQSEIRDLKKIVSKAFLQRYTDEEIAEKMIDDQEKSLMGSEIPPNEL